MNMLYFSNITEIIVILYSRYKYVIQCSNNNNNMYFIYKILELGVQTSKIYDPSC